MNAKDFIGKVVEVSIDRPLGSKHPKFNYTYPVNYGFIEGVMGKDGEYLDAYVLGVNKPLKSFRGKCIALIERLDDNDDKLIVVPEGLSLTKEQIEKEVKFQEQYFTSIIHF